MREIIAEKLKEIEDRENIRVLHAVESGSRAWGFASPDSDYDVRFIYVRPKEYYLKLDEGRDVIEWQLDDTLDINGWDIQKTLRLLHKSNPTVFEWNASPIVYKTTEEWGRVSAILNEYFTVSSGLYHYLNTARGNIRAYLQDDTVIYKKYFYILRPILACKWILAEGTPPPMLFRELMEGQLEDSLKPQVERLLEIKMSATEADRGKPFESINAYIERSVKEIEDATAKLTKRPPKNMTELNKLFLSLLG